jgi:hypothetical protein
MRILRKLSPIVGLAIVGLLGWLLFLSLRAAWHSLIAVNPQLAGPLVAAVASVIAGTGTVMLGRHFERKREIESHFRTKKIEIYDRFLVELFRTFREDAKGTDQNLVEFLREWQRTVVLWGGADVLQAYIRWMSQLKRGTLNAESVFLMDEFFRALRADIGQSSRGLERGAFAHLLFRYAEFFLEQARRNPKLTLQELAELEKKQFGSAENAAKR